MPINIILAILYIPNIPHYINYNKTVNFVIRLKRGDIRVLLGSFSV